MRPLFETAAAAQLPMLRPVFGSIGSFRMHFGSDHVRPSSRLFAKTGRCVNVPSWRDIVQSAQSEPSFPRNTCRCSLPWSSYFASACGR